MVKKFFNDEFINIKMILKFLIFNPSSIFPLIFYLISKVFPLFIFDVKYISKKLEQKQKDITNQKNIGSVRGKRIYSLKVFNFILLKKSFPEGEIATFLQFYLFRPLNDLKFIFKELVSERIKINKNSLIFEPGCGTGKHLIYLNQKYNCSVYGNDSYLPCINIAKFMQGNRKKIYFENFSALDINRLDKFLPKKIDLIYMNSYLNHIFHHNNYFEFIKFISYRSKYIALIINKKYLSDLDLYLQDYIKIKVINQYSTSYILLESKML